MKRWLFSFLAVALLVVWVTTCTFWVRSYFRCETLDWKRYTIVRESPDHRDARSFYERCWLRSDYGKISFAEFQEVTGDPRFIGKGWRTIDRHPRWEFRWKREDAFLPTHIAKIEPPFHSMGIWFDRFTPQILDPGDPPRRAALLEVHYAVLISTEVLVLAAFLGIERKSRKRSSSRYPKEFATAIGVGYLVQ